MKLPALFALLLLAASSRVLSDPVLNVAAMRDWTIVVADDALPSEKYAAAEFQSLFGSGTTTPTFAITICPFPTCG